MIPQDFQGAGDGDWTRAEAWTGMRHGQGQEITGIEFKNNYYGLIVGQMSQGSGQWQGGTLDQTEDWGPMSTLDNSLKLLLVPKPPA